MSEQNGTRYDFTEGVQLEERIDAAAGEDLRARWEFGRWMLSHVPEGRSNLPAGFIAGLAEATGRSEAELKNRRQFAEHFDERALANAVSYSVSWHEISNRLLGSRGEGEELGDDFAPIRTSRWETPQDLFDQLDAEFGFELDVCATTENAKCDRFYSPADDGLRQPWRGVCWMHPPAGEVVEEWVAKARRAAEDHGATVVALLPAKTGADWFWEHCREAEIRFLRGRLDFGGRDAPFASAVVVFGHEPRILLWEREEELAAP